jgi:hypothetical protein
LRELLLDDRIPLFSREDRQRMADSTITVTSFLYRLFTAVIAQWIQDKHAFNKLHVFSHTHNGFVQGRAGCMEHAALTREMISHAQIRKKNLYMVQIDFLNAFGSVPHDFILTNTAAMGLPTVVTDLVKDIYTDHSSKISLVGGDTPFTPSSSGTVQRFPLSPTLFNICLESSLRRMEKPDLLELGYHVRLENGEEFKINAAADADGDLILYTETHENMRTLLHHLEAFCQYAKMKVSAEKGVSISQIWSDRKHPEADTNPFFIRKTAGYNEIPMEMVSFYLEMPIGFNLYQNSKHGQEVFVSMLEDARQIGRSKLRITQKIHALKMFVFPRIDYRMMCADLSRTHFERCDAQIRGMVGRRFGIHGIPVELFQMSWRDDGFSFPSLRDRQNTLVIRTLLSMMTSPDEVTRKLMKQLEIQQARNIDIEYKERDSTCPTGFLNWAPPYDEMEVCPDVPTQSIFPRAFRAHQEDQMSFWVYNSEQFLTHGIAESFKESKISKPAMWITQAVRRHLYCKRLGDRKVIASAFAALEDNSVSNHMFSWATSRYEDRMIRFTLKARLDALPSAQKIKYWNKGKTQSRCPFCGMIGASTRHIQCLCDKRGTNSLVTKRHDRVGCVCGDASRCGHHLKTLDINENKDIQRACQRMSTGTQRFKRPDLVYESVNQETGKVKWELIEIICPWP